MEKLTLVRKVQKTGGSGSHSIIIPSEFSRDLGIEKGDYVKIYVTSNKLVMEKVHIPK